MSVLELRLAHLTKSRRSSFVRKEVLSSSIICIGRCAIDAQLILRGYVDFAEQLGGRMVFTLRAQSARPFSPGSFACDWDSNECTS